MKNIEFKTKDSKQLRITSFLPDKKAIKKWMEERKENNFVKIIMLNEKYSDLNYEEEILEIHKFKSKYPANSYIRFPIFVKEIGTEGEIGFKRIISIEEDESCVDGYVLISKLDLLEHDEFVKKNSTKAQKIDRAMVNCRKEVMDFNQFLNVSVYKVEEVLENNKTEFVTLICGDNDVLSYIKENRKEQ